MSRLDTDSLRVGNKQTVHWNRNQSVSKNQAFLGFRYFYMNKASDGHIEEESEFLLKFGLVGHLNRTKKLMCLMKYILAILLH